jgi:molybdopterin-guanine dinucleotide biosynthesis protein A
MTGFSEIQNIDAVILVGGENRRFNGEQKSLALLNGKSLLDHQLEVLQPLFPNVILVTNKPKEFDRYKHVKITSDIITAKGPLGGIHAGLSNTEKKYIFVFAGDMPFITKEIILQQIQFTFNTPYEAIIPKTSKGIEPLHGIYSRKIIRKLQLLLRKPNVPPVREIFDGINTFYWNRTYNQSFININTQDELSFYEKH